MLKRNKKQPGGANWQDTYGDMVTLLLCFLMLYLMAAYYETIFLIMFILCGTLLLPVVAVMVTYIRLLQIAGQL